MEARRLERFVAGSWRSDGNQNHALLRSATSDLHAVLTSDPDDIGDAVAFARDRGRKGLQSLTLQGRAQMLRKLGKSLNAAAPHLRAESLAAAILTRDSTLDAGNGICAMIDMASKAAAILPDANVLTDNSAESRPSDGLSIQNILVPRPGVAVHICSFDTPVRNLLDAITPALIAGMPCIVRPAADTAFVAELLVKFLADSTLLLPGALQMVYSPIAEILDTLQTGDVLTFSGDHSEAQSIQRHPAVTSGNVHTVISENGLSAAVLGPGITREMPEYASFLHDVVGELLVQNGQRRDAVRRILVPQALEDMVRADLRSALARIRIGSPEDPDAQMSAMVSVEHRNAVCDNIKRLSVECSQIIAPSKRPELVSGDVQKGVFLGPVLLHCDRAEAARAVHEICIQGPAATLMGYSDMEHAVALASRSQRPWAAHLYANSTADAINALPGLATAAMGVRISGRLCPDKIDRSKILPQRFDCDPDGGSDACVLEKISRYMTCQTLQGPPQMLSDLTGRWVEGARTRSDGDHPFRKPLSELKVGDSMTSKSRQITQQDVEEFARFSGDTFYAHMDAEAAKAHPFFEDRVAHGQLVISFANGLLVDPDPGPVLANLGSDNLRFLAPVYFGDTLHVELVCKQITPRGSPIFGEVRWNCKVRNDSGALVAIYELVTLVTHNWPCSALRPC